jgi:energy-coupling factor transporter ATP-binding protein EcfA2
MSDLKLDSLRIQNFRTFKDLTIDRLGRVNLIVGKNNVGKTTLLEALWVWAHDEYWDDLTDELVKSGPDSGHPSSEMLRERYEAIRHLIHGRPQPKVWGSRRANLGRPDEAEVYLGPLQDPDRSDGVYIHVNAEVGSRVQWFRLEAARWHSGKGEFKPVGVLNLQGHSYHEGPYALQPIEAVFVSSTSLNEIEQGELWSNAVREGKKTDVLSLLKAIDKRVEDVDSVRQPLLRGRPQGRSLQVAGGPLESQRFVVTMENSRVPVPLDSLGEGMERSMSIGLGLAGGQDGLTLIDEIENGIHYSAQPKLWQLIFETAKKLNVQVFATTHSYDCVQAFEQVAQDYERSESMLVSLRRREEDPEDIVAVLSDRDELGTVVEENIEVR